MNVELAVCQLVFKPYKDFEAFVEDVYAAIKLKLLKFPRGIRS